MAEESKYKSFLAGTVGGIAQVLSGQPFDIIKVRAASSSTPISASEAFSGIFRNQGILAFWKGSLSPLIGVGACVSIQFGMLNQAKSFFSSRRPNNQLKSMDYVYCGMIAGASNSVVSSPVQLFRIKMQVNGKVDPRGEILYKNDIHCITSVMQNYGLQGMYRGFLVTLVREAVTFGSYFGVYEYYIGTYLVPKHGTRENIPMYKLLVLGGMCGYFYWGPWYPVDSIKSKLQADSLANPRYSGIRDCISKTLSQEGLGGFYKGFLPCMLRAFPSNAATFLGFEATMRLLG